jgi:cytochrome bd-type quinol oxidase subunit 2
MVSCSSIFRTEFWPAAENGRTMYKIHQRIGPVTHVNAEDIWLIIHYACIFAMFPSSVSLVTCEFSSWIRETMVSILFCRKDKKNCW